jgi:anti-sigma B factor antagonist
MNSTTGKLLVWTGPGFACIRVTGRANFNISVDFRRLLRRLAATGQERILIDLSECRLMDSTFLGTLAFEAGQLKRRAGVPGGPKLELLNSNPTVRELIEDLGVAQLFNFVERDLTEEEFKAAPPVDAASPVELTRTCLEAHELLMALHPANVAKFKDAAAFLAEELRRSPSPATPPH